MKNIHILPTLQPSRLVLDVNKNLSLAFNKSIEENAKHRKHIYITSDEEIKEGDWVYCTERKLFGKVIEIQLAKHILDSSMLYFEINDKEIWCKLLNCKKIIITTDQDLIGVQPIDDEFLEWFVQNPSCEEVKVNKLLVGKHIPKINFTYKIIIPKQEPRILTVEAFNKAKISYKEPKQDKIMERFIANAKQETLEEIKQSYFKNGFKEGAKWQQERSYSEEEVLPLLEILQKCKEYFLLKTDKYSDERADAIIDVIEQFKKK